AVAPCCIARPASHWQRLLTIGPGSPSQVGALFGPIAQQLFHMRDKAVPSSWYGFDIMRIASVVAKRLPESLDVESQVCFFSERVGPQTAHQLVLLRYPAAVQNKDQKRLENLWSKRQRLALPQQNLLINVKRELSELIQMLGPQRHDGSRISLRTF